MKKMILMILVVLGAMPLGELNAQDRKTDASDHPSVENGGINPETGMVEPVGETNVSQEGNLIDNDEEDDREILQDNAEEQRGERPSSSIDSTERRPEAIPAHPSETDKRDEINENGTESSDTIQDNATEAERGIGTNSSDSNINYRTGMPSNTTTPKQLKD